MPAWGVILVVLLAVSLGVAWATLRQQAAELRTLRRKASRMEARLQATVAQPQPVPDGPLDQMQVLPLPPHDAGRDAADVTATLADYPPPERTSLVDQAWESVRQYQEARPLPVPERVPETRLAEQTEAAVAAMRADTQLLLAGTRDQPAEPEWDLDVPLDDPKPAELPGLADAYDVYPADDEGDDDPPPPSPGGGHLPPAEQPADTATMPMVHRHRYDWSRAGAVAPLHWGRGLMRRAATASARLYVDPQVRVRRVVATVGDWLPGLVTGRHVIRRHRRGGGSWAVA